MGKAVFSLSVVMHSIYMSRCLYIFITCVMKCTHVSHEIIPLNDSCILAAVEMPIFVKMMHLAVKKKPQKNKNKTSIQTNKGVSFNTNVPDGLGVLSCIFIPFQSSFFP